MKVTTGFDLDLTFRKRGATPQLPHLPSANLNAVTPKGEE
jgi:hypothetical protein